MPSKPTVSHFIRCYLPPTETFIGNQIFSLQTFRPIIICHSRTNNHGFQHKDTFCSTEILRGFPRVFANFSYRTIRRLSGKEREVFCDIIDIEKVKLMHFHYTVDARFFLSLKKRLNLPSIVSCYGYDVSSFPRFYWGYGKKYIMPVFEEIDIFLAMSEDMKKDLLKIGCPEDKILIHYHGINTERFAYPERKYEDKKVLNILMCGTLEVKKAQHLVLKALRKLELKRNLRRKFRLTIVGNGPMKNQLVQMVKNFKWQNKVTFNGHIPYQNNRLVEEYKKADIFALPSITVKGDKEGIPGTIVEAMTSGLSIISTYHAGIPEVLKNGEQGILVKERDLDGLIEGLWRLLDDQPLREQFGRAAAKRAIKEFDRKKRIINLERIYNSLI